MVAIERIAPEDVKLSHDEIRRYSRHLIMPEVGMEGQRKLKAASVLLIGTGGLGSPLALYLAAAGIGRIGLVDYDVVDETQPAAAGYPRHQRRWASPSSTAPPAACSDINPYRQVDKLRRAAHRPTTRWRSCELRHHHRRDRQLPDALSGQRRLRAAGQAQRLRQHLPLRGPG